MKRLEKNIEGVLLASGMGEEEAKKVAEQIASVIPPKVYLYAVMFLGAATMILAIGSIVLASCNGVPEALWAALGAGLGGLAGIFSGNK